MKNTHDELGGESRLPWVVTMTWEMVRDDPIILVESILWAAVIGIATMGPMMYLATELDVATRSPAVVLVFGCVGVVYISFVLNQMMGWVGAAR